MLPWARPRQKPLVPAMRVRRGRRAGRGMFRRLWEVGGEEEGERGEDPGWLVDGSMVRVLEKLRWCRYCILVARVESSVVPFIYLKLCGGVELCPQ